MNGLSERHVQAIWYDAALRPKNLITRKGSEVHVISPGVWNSSAGPDFQQAILEVGSDRKRMVGDVEVHLTPSDWDLHGHGSDPAYRNVIAHVTWRCGPEPASLCPGAISIWLGRFLTPKVDFDPAAIDLDAYPFGRLPLEERPCARTWGRSPDTSRPILAAAGRRRLRMKARRILGRLCERTAAMKGDARRQVFYEEVMAAFGYSKNAAAFRAVASRVPLAELPTDTESARTALLVAAEFEDWSRNGLRPYNRPEKRLERAAEILTSTQTLTLSDAHDFSTPACQGMINTLRGNRLLGRGRAAAILANVIVPFALAEDRLTDAPEWLPAEDISQPVRLTASRLFGRDHNPAAFYASNGLLIQGLIQIYRDQCQVHHPECVRCELISPRFRDCRNHRDHS